MILGIIRGTNKDNILPAIEAGLAGGLDQVEITLNSPDALAQIRLASKHFPVWAGTVLSLKEAKAALKAGAKFIVSPIADPATIKYCKKNHIPIYPCGVTPNEVFRAWELGATMVKVFPVQCFGGPKLIKELKGPFQNIKLLACGGVRPDNIKEYFAAGADAVAVGASVFRPEWLASGNFDAIRQKAREYSLPS